MASILTSQASDLALGVPRWFWDGRPLPASVVWSLSCGVGGLGARCGIGASPHGGGTSADRAGSWHGWIWWPDRVVVPPARGKSKESFTDRLSMATIHGKLRRRSGI